MLIEAELYKVKLFQRKTVYDILWGYKDPFLEFLVKATQGIHIPIIDKNLTCPGQDGLTDFVQLQVSDQKYYSPLSLLLLKAARKSPHQGLRPWKVVWNWCNWHNANGFPLCHLTPERQT